jgi:hypothetical protein
VTAPWYSPFKKAFLSGCHLLAHTFVAVLIVGLVSLVQRVLIWDGDRKLFDIFPLRYIFDLSDVALLAVFLVFGTLQAIHVFREKADD